MNSLSTSYGILKVNILDMSDYKSFENYTIILIVLLDNLGKSDLEMSILYTAYYKICLQKYNLYIES
jgi:hypothetical protein